MGTHAHRFIFRVLLCYESMNTTVIILGHVRHLELDTTRLLDSHQPQRGRFIRSLVDGPERVPLHVDHIPRSALRQNKFPQSFDRHASTNNTLDRRKARIAPVLDLFFSSTSHASFRFDINVLHEVHAAKRVDLHRS